MGRYFLFFPLLFTAICGHKAIAKARQDLFPTMEALDAKYQAQWSNPKYAAAHLADTVKYLNTAEKKIYYYLNLVRIDPQLFAATYADGYKGANGYTNFPEFASNERSLIKQLKSLSPLHALGPNKRFYGFASCQANAVVTKHLANPHDRQSSGCPKPGNYGECAVAFVQLSPLDIVMGWLNDSANVYGPTNLGHRKICLEPGFKSLGVSAVNFGKDSETAIADFSFDE